MEHVINLTEYVARTDTGRGLTLGTSESFGNERLLIQRGPGWERMEIAATFYPPPMPGHFPALPGDEEGPWEVKAVGDVVTVPREATAYSGIGTIVFTGKAAGRIRHSNNLYYTVDEHKPYGGEVPPVGGGGFTVEHDGQGHVRIIGLMAGGSSGRVEVNGNG